MRFLRSVRRNVTALFAAFALMWGTTAVAFVGEQVELDQQMVQNFIASFPEMDAASDKYDDLDDFDDIDEIESWPEELARIGALDEFNGIVRKYGFADVQTWFRTLTSIAVAHAFGSQDVDMDSQLEETIREIRENEGMSDEQKEMLIQQIQASLGMVAAMKPSQQNMDAVKPFAGTLDDLFDD